VIAPVLAVFLAASGSPGTASLAARGVGVTQADSSTAAAGRVAPADSAAEGGAHAAPADSSSPAAPAGAEPASLGPRVPGSWLRLGSTEGQVLARGAFPVVPGVRGFVTREGATSWFGLPSTATLKFRADLLSRAEFVVEDVAPYWVDYVRDQLRIAGYRARCERNEPGLMICDWEGATHVRLERREHRLLAIVYAAESTAPRAAVPARPRAATPKRTALAPRDTVPVFPQVFVLGRAAPAGVATVPSLVDSTPLLKPPYPAGAREAGVQGRVWVRALVDTNGAVEAAEIVRSIPELDSTAIAVARSCRFRPYTTAGATVRFRVEIPVMFTVR